MVESYLPAMRILVARRLRSMGLSQSRISSLLGVTQASVSNYLSSKGEKPYATLERFSVSRKEADENVGRISEGVLAGPVQGVEALTSIWTGLLGAGSVCGPHRADHPGLADCEVCIELYGAVEKKRSLGVAEVSAAVRILESSATFPLVVPQVSANLASLAFDSDSPDDVVAVPGRIVRVKGRAMSVLPPAAGASSHLSKFLLTARRRRPEFRACINLLYDNEMKSALSTTRVQSIEVSSRSVRGEGDPATAALERRLKAPATDFWAVVDRGGEGIEPSTYLFGRSAREVATLAVRVSDAYEDLFRRGADAHASKKAK